MDTETYTINGLNGRDSTYQFNPISRQHIATIAEQALPNEHEPRQDEQHVLQPYHIPPLSVAHINELKALSQQSNTQASTKPHVSFDPHNLTEAGWGILFAEHDQRAYAIHEALNELLHHRAKQAGNRYKVFIGANAYRPEKRTSFLQGRPTIIDPDRVPYYILIVGEPDIIPWEFHYHLACYHAVGRIAFETLDEYAHYAHSVVAAEQDTFALPRTATFFGTCNPDDPTTHMSTKYLIQPLAAMLHEDYPDWHIQTMIGEQATRQHLHESIGGTTTPALLFASGHGVTYPRGTPKRIYHQGAIVCQDWPGPVQWQQPPLPEDFYVAGTHIDAHACLAGTIAFLCASSSAGTSHAHTANTTQRAEKAMPHAFIAELPRRMLGHNRGGALAVVGHRAYVWSHSYSQQESQAQPQHTPQLSETQAFRNTLNQLMGSNRLGVALNPFRIGYREAIVALSNQFPLDLQTGIHREQKEHQVATLWAISRNLRDYVIIGDPAVQLRVGDTPSTSERLSHTPATIALPSSAAFRPSSTSTSIAESSTEEEQWNPRKLEQALKILLASLADNNPTYRRLQTFVQNAQALKDAEHHLHNEKRKLADLQNNYKEAHEEEQHYLQQIQDSQNTDVGQTNSITIENARLSLSNDHTLTIEDFIEGHKATFSADATLSLYEVLKQHLS